MTNRERLIELKINFVENFDCGDCKPSNNKCRKCLSEKEADYLIEHGVIVLPCKPGKILYCESAIKGYLTYLVAPDLEWIFENREKFGKEIFFTREEAEKALKERESK